MRRFPFEVWLAALILITHLYVLFIPANSLMAWFGSDDAFYYFKTAQNISEGHGITFDQLGRDSGFHPLWMALLVPVFALARFDLILPLRIVALLSSLLTLGTALLLYRLARRGLGPLAAAFAALFWVFYPLIHSTVTEMGLESALSSFFILLLLTRLARAEQPGSPASAGLDARGLLLTGLIGALTILARLDNVFLVAVAGAWLVVRPSGMRYRLLGDLALVPLGVMWSYLVRVGFGPNYAQFASSALWMIAAALGARLGLYYLFGLYQRPGPGWRGLSLQVGRGVLASLFASGLLTALMLGLFALGRFPSFPRLVLAYEAGAGLLGVLLVRLVTALLEGWRPNRALSPDEPFCWGPSLARAAGFALPIALILLVYMGAHQAYFGTLSPISGQVKRWWGTLPSPIYGRPVNTLPGLLGIIDRSSPWALVNNLTPWPKALPGTLRLLVYGLPLLAVLIWRWRAVSQTLTRILFFPLLAGCFVQMISYTGTGYLHMRSWYWVSNLLLITLLLGVLLDTLLKWIPAHLPGLRAANALAVGLSLLVVIYGAAQVVRVMPWSVSQENETYYLVGIHEMEAATEPGVRIGSTGGGVIAYFVHDRTIINLDGLMNTTAYFRALQSGTAAAYLDQLGMQYVYAGEYPITSSDPYFQFKGRLQKLGDFGGSTLFRWLKP